MNQPAQHKKSTKGTRSSLYLLDPLRCRRDTNHSSSRPSFNGFYGPPNRSLITPGRPNVPKKFVYSDTAATKKSLNPQICENFAFHKSLSLSSLILEPPRTPSCFLRACTQTRTHIVAQKKIIASFLTLSQGAHLNLDPSNL